MKRYQLIFVFLCFAFSIALFSNESVGERVVEAEQRDEEQAVNANTATPEVANPKVSGKENIQEDEEKEKEKSKIEGDIQKAEKDATSKMNSEKKESEKTTSKEETKKSDSKKEPGKKDDKKEVPKVAEVADFSSIQVSGLTMCKGSRWYFEEYDEQGNMISSASYDRRKLIEKTSIEYSEGKKVAATFTDPKMIVKVQYNHKGVEIARDELTNEKGEIGKPLNSSSGVYDENENLLEETKVENGVTMRYVYTYNNKEKATETIYEDGKQALFIEYSKGKKTVHIFHEGEEVAVFNEEIE